jgi:hypothetical protein
MTCSPTAKSSGASTNQRALVSTRRSFDGSGRHGRAGDTGRDERHRRDARTSDGEVSCGVGEGDGTSVPLSAFPIKPHFFVWSSLDGATEAPPAVP